MNQIRKSFGNSLYSNVGRGRARDYNHSMNSSFVLLTNNSNENQDKQNKSILRKSFSTRLNKTNFTRIDSSIDINHQTIHSQQKQNS